MKLKTEIAKGTLSDILIDSKYIAELLKAHHPNLWNKWSNRLVEMFLSLSDEDK